MPNYINLLPSLNRKTLFSWLNVMLDSFFWLLKNVQRVSSNFGTKIIIQFICLINSNNIKKF